MKGKRHEQAEQKAQAEGSRKGGNRKATGAKASQAAEVLAALLGGDHEQADVPVVRHVPKRGNASAPAPDPRASADLPKVRRQDEPDRGANPPARTWLDIDPAKYPKKHAPGALKRGDSVWYHGTRYWIEFAPSSWDKGTSVRISNEPVHPEPTRPLPTDTADPAKSRPLESFCVYADVLDLAPANSNIYGRQPTVADVARRERLATGQRDVGDDVANLLREAGKGGLDGCYAAAADFLGVAEADLRAKYGHLNPGQQRMNLGNRMRAYAKKQHR